MLKEPVPPVLYKYLSPERFHVLTDCRVRFSQRTVFEDDHELQPEYAKFGTEDEIERHIERTGLSLSPVMSSDVLAKMIAQNPAHQARSMETAVKNIRSIHEMGILCLKETANSERMWSEYADRGRGFVIAFDTRHIGFGTLTKPMGVRKVLYSDALLATFLGMMENDPFGPLYRKRMKYSFEQEWRSIRLLKDLEPCPGDIFLSPFDPASVGEIIIGPDCILEGELQKLIETDARYQSVKLRGYGAS